MRGKKVTLVLLIIFFVGLSILLYPMVSQYLNSKVQSKAIDDYEKKFSNISSDDYKKMFEEAKKYNEELLKLDYPLAQYNKLTGYNDILNLNDNGMIGYVSIEKIKVELPIYHGTSSAVLNVAAGHMEGSSLPVGGESTHSIISAHRGLPSSRLFTDLDKMELGDTFTITVLNQTLTYQVDKIEVIEPKDVKSLEIIEDEDYVTLLTCTPYGINTHRLLVRGKRIENVSKKKLYVTYEAYKVDRFIVTIAIALPILLGLIIYVMFKPSGNKKGGI